MGDIWPYGPPERVGYNGLYNSVIAARGNAYEADVLAAIGMAESGADLRVINDTPATGDYSVGAFQVNYYGSLWGPRSAEFGTPQQLIQSAGLGQAHAALVILGQQGFSAWSTYSSGAYRQYLHGADGASPQTGPGGTGAGQPTVQEGSTGPAVVTLQQDLNLIDHAGLTADGVFGPLTRAAVITFQARHGLAQDGIAGPLTWAAIGAALQAIQTPASTPTAPPPPSEPPGHIDPASVAQWSSLVISTGPALGAQIRQGDGWGTAIGGIR